jgi:hypothetical protein
MATLNSSVSYLKPNEVIRLTQTSGPISRALVDNPSSISFKVGAIYDDRSADGPDEMVDGLFERRAQERDELMLWVRHIRMALTPGNVNLVSLGAMVAAEASSATPRQLATTAIIGTLKKQLEETPELTPDQRRQGIDQLLAMYDRRLSVLTEQAQRLR